MSQMKEFLGSTAGLICSLVAAVIGAYLLVYHLAHVVLLIPYLFLMACPLMHLMHRGHHHHGGSTSKGDKIPPPTEI